MKHQRLRLTVPRALLAAIGLAAMPWLSQAQTTGSPQASGTSSAIQDWRQANDTVGQFPRGHADVLRWEAAQPSAKKATMPSNGSGQPVWSLPTAAQAVRSAWQAHPELDRPLAHLGAASAGLMAEGDMETLDPGLQRRVHHADDVLALAVQVRKAWIDAVAARQKQTALVDALTAAEAAAELGQRMVSVGHWNRLQQSKWALALSAARMAVQQAQLEARQAERSLLTTLRVSSAEGRVDLPDRLPDVAPQPMSREEFARRLASIAQQLPASEQQWVGARGEAALDVHRASHAIHAALRDDVAKQRERVSEETLLRYNGMLESVWGLLADVEVRMQAVVATIAAQRDALWAEADLEWVLQGGQPQAFVALGGARMASPNATSAH